MNDPFRSSTPSTTPSVRATSADRGEGDYPHGDPGPVPCEGEGTAFLIGEGVRRGAFGRPHERQPDEPLYRPLWIYPIDPGSRKDEGAVAVVNVPFECLERGVRGCVFRVAPVLAQPADELATKTIDIDLDDPLLLLASGRTPSPVDPRFHQQMVYAVASLVYATFRRALGRHLAWGFGPSKEDEADGRTRLTLEPHGRRGPGASYDRDSGTVRFGFIMTERETRGRAAPGGHTFSCVSHDIVTHEVTHALLDGLRAHFLEPTSPDVLGFHEGFADVIALLHHFSYTEVVRAAVRRCHGKLLQSALLTSIAREFGLNIGNGGPIRSLTETLKEAREMRARMALLFGAKTAAEDADAAVPVYREDMGPHEMGQVFVSAVFHAFVTIFGQKIERYLRLASQGTGLLPPGDISTDLQDVLVDEAGKLASQFLDVCIRAIDYCPPVDLQLGEFLRAVITADLDLVPDDPWGYREAWIDAFALHRIFPAGVESMSEDQLKWPYHPAQQKAAGQEPLVIPELSFTNLEFDGDPACAANESELRKRACALGAFVAKHPKVFGLITDPTDPLLAGDGVSLPKVQSVRTSRRVGPDGQVVFDLVAEVTQTRRVEKEPRFLFHGGCTVILGPRGEVRYVIFKSVGENGRLFRQRKFMIGAGAVHVSTDDDGYEHADSRTVQFSHQHP